MRRDHSIIEVLEYKKTFQSIAFFFNFLGNLPAISPYWLHVEIAFSPQDLGKMATCKVTLKGGFQLGSFPFLPS